VNNRRTNLDRFYGALAELEVACGGKRRLADCDAHTGWPRRGIYFFFEDGEFRQDGATPRVVRVGTHGLRPSKSTLWSRLAQHRGSISGAHPGGGNHRGSIFRLHVGTALLAKGNWPDDIRQTWGRGSSADQSTMHAEYPLELEVSSHIGAMPFLWFAVDDEPTKDSMRGVIERGSIGLLSNLDREHVDPSSSGWLGRKADRSTIRQAGMWNVNHVGEPVQVDWIDQLIDPTA